MISRIAANTLIELARGYPILVLTGPRQSGKSTLAKSAFAAKPYVSLENPDTRRYAAADPVGFLDRFPDGAVLDEAQRAPELFSYLQTRVDEDGRMGLFVLTGSQQLGLLSRVTQSLSGRAALVPLLPFSFSELAAGGKAPADLESLLFTGSYPPIYDRALSPEIWHANYAASYLERDVRQILNVRDLDAFDTFLRMCAARTGQMLNLSALAADCGVTHNTAKAWLSVLQAAYVIHLLRPHHRNFGKRLVKTPKLYFIDCGLAAHLMGIQNPAQLAAHPQRGALFETWAVGELLKSRFNAGKTSNLYYWRSRAGAEVDSLIERGDALVPVEFKSGRTLNNDFFIGLERWRLLAGGEASPAYLVYGGEECGERSGCVFLSWRAIGELTV
ncbi:MAG: AAA family ATPase [Elusimicrobia bacterium CG1_02_63_36]|nr:MAG: AAA family ATPase [Elusimicrobia bacterium CG1_02_63_36]PIP81829.1 MAG: AAA family ATPase [Elusimicrobia bacterium CG22_combo_CG10-13_8_21_14_all_63_91]PJA11506.1 MAG: AAA family ATPase [Elusimicrobia bacterium CG_4_10_14_0_2_um_filter_63_34]PJB24341.1 MAG: AAA family ATPase [Elusimicrobia bacterium CG_4_9_14_3_um_filter_62_55]